jgi:hypothetical protein
MILSVLYAVQARMNTRSMMTDKVRFYCYQRKGEGRICSVIPGEYYK